MPNFLVESVERGNPWTSTKGGPMQSWKLMVNDGNTSFAAEISTKEGNDGPAVGERFEATVTPGEGGYPPKLKKVFANAGGAGKSTGDFRSPEQIMRTTAHEFAMKQQEVKAIAGRLTEPLGWADYLKVVDAIYLDIHGAQKP